MSGFYGIAPRVWHGKRLRQSEGTGPDLYDPSSPGYRERARETVKEISPGMSLVTLGHPPGTPSPVSVNASVPDFTPAPNPAPVTDHDQPTTQNGRSDTLPEYKPGLGRG